MILTLCCFFLNLFGQKFDILFEILVLSVEFHALMECRHWYLLGVWLWIIGIWEFGGWLCWFFFLQFIEVIELIVKRFDGCFWGILMLLLEDLRPQFLKLITKHRSIYSDSNIWITYQLNIISVNNHLIRLNTYQQIAIEMPIFQILSIASP